MNTVTDIAARRLEKANVRMVELRRSAAAWKKTLEPIIGSVDPKVIPSGVELLNVLHAIVTEEETKGYLAITFWSNKKVEQLSMVLEACKQQVDGHRRFLQSSENSAMNEWPQEMQAMEKALAALKVDTQKRAEKKSDELREEHIKKLSSVDATLGMGCLGLLAGGAIFIVVAIVAVIFQEAVKEYAKTPLLKQFEEEVKSNGVMGFMNFIPTISDQWMTPEFWWVIAGGLGYYGWIIFPIIFFVVGILNHIRHMMKINRMAEQVEAQSKAENAGKLEKMKVELTELQKKIADHLPTNRLHAATKKQVAELSNALTDIVGQLLTYRRKTGE
ncbi:hypothetical protein [Prosthecobacter dejongeii]|uniref:Putative membrane protein n=1 Tax=Prosthecobacter dejongeii TaxID=48465 RepID=A0A7W7YKQ5_9BACT|nr:hypothetical protein [Prosthecobacter dejongeii]MBB5037782.1 putative membrane protein [Prosthecobacter dejongeii]